MFIKLFYPIAVNLKKMCQKDDFPTHFNRFRA